MLEATQNPKTKRNTKRLLLKTLTMLTLLFVVLVLLFIVGAFSLDNAHKLNHYSTIIHNHTIVFMLWRYTIMAAIAFLYPAIMHKLFSGKSHINHEKIAKASKRRWIILVFIIYELVIIHNVLSYPINWLINH